MRQSLLLPRFSLGRPVTVVMMFVALLVIGLIAYARIPLELTPLGHENRWLGVWIPYGSSSPAVVEQRITRPTEGVLRTMSGVERVRSTSHGGGMWMSVVFRQGTDMAEAYNQLRDRCDRVMAVLPDDVRRVYVRQWSDEDRPILGIDIVAAGDNPNLHEVIEEHVKRPMEALDGIANVAVYGTRAASVQIDLSRERMNVHRVDADRLYRQLRQENFAMSSGWMRDGTSKLYVRSDCRFASLDEIRNLPIDGCAGLTLSDIAEVEYTRPERRWHYRIDGTDAAWISVRKKSSANTVEVTQQALDLLNNDLLQRPQLRGFEPYVYFSQAEYITSSLNQLRSSGLWGGLFAAIILLLVLRRVRTALLIAAAIPLSIMISLGVVYFTGWSLNIITMMGLIIAFGMVVDNSIVVVEAIYARRMDGEPPASASLRGASEVGLAITVSTTTTLVVFLPLMFMTGNQDAGFFLARIGMPVIYALLASLVVALVFVPLASRYIMSGRPPAEPRTVARLNVFYRRGLDWVMAHRLEAVLVAIVAYGTISIPQDGMKPKPSEERWNSLYISFDLPDDYDVARSDSIMSQYETYFIDRREEYGLEEIQVDFSRGRGSVWSPFTRDRREWYTITWHNIVNGLGFSRRGPMPKKAVFDSIRTNAPRFVGVRMSIDEVKDETKRTSVTLFGEDTETLLRLSSEVERRLRLIRGVTEVDSDVESGREELVLEVNRPRAQLLGVSSADIARTVGAIMRGATLSRYHTADREVDVTVRLDDEDRRTLDQVLGLTIATPGGERVPLYSLVDVSHDRGLGRIHRDNGRTRIRVTAISTQEGMENLRERVLYALGGLEMPRGYQWSFSGRFEEMREERSEMSLAITLAVAFVFLLMGILFESFIMPLSVLVSIPFSFLGVYWMLYLTGTGSNEMEMSYVGMIVLVGVVVNNAIVLVDLMNRLRADGMVRRDAILEAGRRRFRPIVLTSITTIMGLLPMTLGGSVVLGSAYNVLGVTLIGGLLSSTFFTLFVVPLFYTLLDDLREAAARIYSSMTARIAGVQQVG